MIKRALFVSSLLAAMPLQAAGQPDPLAPAAGAVAEKTVVTGAAGRKTATGAYSPERQALLNERLARQRELNVLKAQRDSELTRLSQNRIAASRGGDPDFSEKKNQQMLRHMRERDAYYKGQLAEAQARVKVVDGKLGALDEKEKAAGSTGGKSAAQ